MRTVCTIVALFTAGCAAAACGSGGGGTGTLAVSVTDAPFPATEDCLAAANVVVDRVTVQTPDGGFLDVPLDPLADAADGNVDGKVTVNLLELRAGLSASIAAGELPTGTYHQIRLHVVEAILVFADADEDGQPDAPDRTFKVPSGMESGIKINVEPHFAIAHGQTTPLLLDFDLAHSFQFLVTGSGGSPTCDDLKDPTNQVIFRPVVRALATFGVIAGVVTDGLLPVGDVEVTAFPAGTTVDATTEPTATTFSAPSGVEGVDEGAYALALPAGTYDLYVRPQGALDRTLAAEDVVVTAGEITEQDLTVP